jgi:hypothetical protein
MTSLVFFRATLDSTSRPISLYHDRESSLESVGRYLLSPSFFLSCLPILPNV